MTFGEILYALFLQPLQILFEVVYGFTDELFNNSGLSIIILSLAMNFLVLPLYKHADKMQEEERDVQEKLKDGVNHIKKSFKGDEKMMMLQTYYRQNNYKPTYVLRSASSLLLQVPFFIAAYRFLSNLESLHNVSFGIINDLSKPDGLITLFGLTINVLPIIMTVINLISSAVYSKGYPLKNRIQLYLTAAVFLVLLYNSPSGLAFYWTLNNAFSLLKNILSKLKNPSKVLSYASSVSGVIALICGFIFKSSLKNKTDFYIIICFAVLAQYPIIIQKLIINRKNKKKKNTNEPVVYEPNVKSFLVGGLFMTVLTGAVIPTYVIVSSPQEFINTKFYCNPLWYVLSALCIAAGTFIIWLGIFYIFSPAKRKVLFEKSIWIICGVSTLNYMAFGDWGTLSSALSYMDDVYMFNKTYKTALPNLLLIFVVYFIFKLIYNKKKQIITAVLTVCIIAFSIMSVYNCVIINSSVAKYKNVKPSTLQITLNKNEKNVVFIMIDTAMGQYVPYMFNEKPELKKQFDGFTYYANTVSFGRATNFGTPALFGGYEYTPAELNLRNDTPLVEKHNEALKVMPVIFNSNNYNVSVYNPSYANYQHIPDLSIYDDYPEISAQNIDGSTVEKVKESITRNKRNFFLYSVARISPVFLQPVVNDQGLYFKNNDKQICNDKHIANGTSGSFMSAYNILGEFPKKTTVDTQSEKGNFIFLTNDTTHDFQLLKEPEYEPAEHVNNTEYDKQNTDRFTIDGITLHFSDAYFMSQYHSNMAAMIQLGKWFDYLREQGVYDNTKIIIAADHGYRSAQIKELIMEIDGTPTDVENFYPLLMVKDFNSKGFKTSNEFMTNADVPTIAFKDAVENPVNPFTKKPINNNEKYAHNQYILDSMEHSVLTNSGNTYHAGRWYSVHDSLWDKNNWKKLADKDVLDSKKAQEIDNSK